MSEKMAEGPATGFMYCPLLQKYVLEKSPCSNREHKHYDWNGLAYGALLESLPERGKAD